MEFFRKILVPVDGSLQSKTSQHFAIFLANLFESQVTLLHVVSHELMTMSGQTYPHREDYTPISTATGQFPRTVTLPKAKDNLLPDEVINEVTERYREKGETLMAEAFARFKAAGILPRQKFAEDVHTADAILTEAESESYDLLVMGNSGAEENEEDTHLGSVAKRVSLTSKIPILIVRESIQFVKVLGPVDGSSRDTDILEYAAAIAKKANAKLTLLHVQEKGLLNIRPELEKAGYQILKEGASKAEGLEVEQKLLSGDPAKIITKVAADEQFDLVIMSGKSSGLRKLFLGSVVDHVLHHATVPVLIIR